MKAPSSRLLALKNELQDLDDEIRDINQFLEEKSDDENNKFSISIKNSHKTRNFAPKQRDSRLYRESVEILERRTHQTNNLMNENDTFMPPKKTFNLKNYKPPSQRIDETRIRRSQSVRRAREQNEKEFREEYTFRPKIIHRKEIDQNYDPDHLLRPTPRKRVFENNNNFEPQRRVINKRSEQLAEKAAQENGDDFFVRQFRRKRSQSVQRMQSDSDAPSTKKRRLTKQEEREMLEHLAKPRPVYTLKDQVQDETPKKKKRSDPSVFEHLVKQSMRKEEPVPEEPSVKPKMNARSRKLTENKPVNLYEQSLESKVRRDKLAEEQKNWEEMQKLSECTFRPKIIKRTLRQEQQQWMPTRVAGIDDFLDRMKKRTVDEEEEVKPIPRVRRGAVLQKPFSFDKRTPQTQVPDEKDVDNVLSEINQLLAIV